MGEFIFMTIKGIYKLIVHPSTFVNDYLKKICNKKNLNNNFIISERLFSVISSEIISSKENFLEIKSFSINDIFYELIKYMRIYKFSEKNIDYVNEYGIDSKEIKAFLVLLHFFSISGIVSISFILRSKKYILNKDNINDIFNNLKKINSFFLNVENIDGKQYKVLFQIADINNNFLIFRGNNVLYKKQKVSEINSGFIDLKELNQHYYPSLFLWDEPVDIVYTWVNSEDENWREMILKYKSEEELDFDRYKNFDELKYSLRSIEQHIPWVRNIYIVTNCVKPDWLGGNNKHIKWIWHEDIFPNQDYLPTFNSHAIESCLHRITGLSEYFIYFNDDVFIMNDLKKTNFFNTNGCSISFMEPYGTSFYPRKIDNETYINAALNVKRLLEKEFNISPVQYHKHVPHVLRKSVLSEMENRFKENYDIVRKNKFREESDISTISFMYHHYSYIKKESVRGDCLEHLIRHTNYKIKTQSIKKIRPDFICINDGGGSSNDSEYKKWMLEFLEKYYPTPAVWEKNVETEN